jgi:hypothetical protein
MDYSYRTFVRSGVSTKPGQVHSSDIEYSPRSASATNRTRSFMGSVSVQGMFTSR